jgi:hypothetical protein
MTLDIGPILDEWPYESGQVSARRITGADEREKIQLRLDLGILQMEVAGRPDGRRPEGFESLLDYYEHELETFRRTHGTDEGYTVDEDGCEQLRSEGTMYYHRYLAEFVLEDYPAVQRDTVRNLRLFDFCRAYAREESDRYALEQYRPYVIMMMTRARARLALGKNKPKRALADIRRGLNMIRRFYRWYGQEKAFASSSEAEILRAMAKEVEARIPVPPAEKIKRQLAKAIKEERYEDAARLRDRLAELQQHQAGKEI